MTGYRAYIVGPGDHIRAVRQLDCADDQAAIEATLQGRYEPVAVNGIPVTVISVVTHNFSFKTKAE